MSAKITPGKSIKRSAANPAPIAVWLTGPEKNSQSTEVRTFTLGKPETLHADLQRAIFELVRSHLASHAARRIIPLPAEGAPDLALGSHITRLDWQKLGGALNQAVERP